MQTIPVVVWLMVAGSVVCGCSQSNGGQQHNGTAVAGRPPEAELARYSRAVFAAGCFWCVEAVFESVNGVAEAVSGYAGGHTEHPTYREVGLGTTGHAEAVEVYYDSTVVDYPTLLKVFFVSQDPTQVNGQGPDIGTQYRSVVFYRNPVEQRLAGQYIAGLNASGRYAKPVATQVVPLAVFWQAEEYHQDYVRLHPDDSYVRHESLPRLRRAQQQAPELIRPDPALFGE